MSYVKILKLRAKMFSLPLYETDFMLVFIYLFWNHFFSDFEKIMNQFENPPPYSPSGKKFNYRL